MFAAYLDGKLTWPHFEAADIFHLRDRLNVTRLGLAKLLGVSLEEVIAWERHEAKVPSSVDIALTVLRSLGTEAFKLMNQEGTDGREKNFLLVPTSCTGHYLDCDDPEINLALQEDLKKLPEVLDAKFVKSVRSRLGLSQVEFSKLLDISLSALVKWECGSVTPRGPALILLKILWREGAQAIP